MWLFGATTKRGHAYYKKGLMQEMISRGINSSGRRLLHLRITPNFLEQENLILLKCQSMRDSKEELASSRRCVSTRFIASPLKTKSG